ncbi:response regulator transcription factor [Pedobacter sp. JY14-1]|uniref:response regulator n=1 Tax=Pedobacter sp. JY14-1 TaxID=3034151 RepID=UPI0023E34682|nr:response regulator transcription factor [Pedobacter sp. JY14-1]
MIRLIIAEDNEVVRQSLGRMLGAEPGIVMVASATTGTEVLKILRSGITADIVLADMNMPEMDGIELTAYLKTEYPAVKVIILTMHSKQVFLERARNAGALGYVLKHAEMNELIGAVRLVADGGSYFL